MNAFAHSPGRVRVGLRRLAAVPAQATTGGSRSSTVLDDAAHLVLVSAIVFAVFAWSDAPLAIAPEAALAAAIWFGTLRRTYRSNVLSPLVLGLPVASAAGATVGLGGVAASTALLPDFEVAAADALISAGAIAVGWAGYASLVDHRLGPRRRLLVVGTTHRGQKLIRELRARPELPFELVGVVSDDWNPDDRCLRGSVDELLSVIHDERADLVVLAGVEGGDRDRVIEQLLDGFAWKVEALDDRQFYEHALGRVPVDDLSLDWFMGLLRRYRRSYSRFSKRAFDVCVAGVCLVVGAPLLGLVALLVRCSGPGGVLFRQVRLGEGGRLFEIVKFRTMVDGAERDGGAVWAAENDARITGVGALLRRARLDELPQLWNVLRGEMSIVGPRPERPEFLATLTAEVPFWTRRQLVKPGITGWAQVHSGYASDLCSAGEKLSYDLYYLKHRSLLLDLAILVMTVGTVATGAGAR